MTHYEDYLILLALSLPVCGAWYWLYKKFLKDRIKIYIAAGLSTVIITPLIYIALIKLLLFYMCYYPLRDFEQARWASEPEKRYEMSAQMIKSKMLVGKTKGQVKAMLGKQLYVIEGDKWYYYLGFKPAFAIDADELLILFDNDKVVEVKLVKG